MQAVKTLKDGCVCVNVLFVSQSGAAASWGGCRGGGRGVGGEGRCGGGLGIRKG